MTATDAPPVDAPHAEDAFGRMVWDSFHDALVERPQYRRDDDQVTEAHLDAYFTDPEDWSEGTHAALDRLAGRVVDVGCGPGKHARYLQSEGREVFAIDRSPGAIAVAREWGVDHPAVMDMRDLDVLGGFDGCYALGKQVAVGDSTTDLEATLRTLAAAVDSGGRLVADFDSLDRRGDGYVDDHLIEPGVAYRRFRVEYDGRVGPWTDLLFVDRDALDDIVAPTPWRPVETIDGEGSTYFVVFERK